MGFAEGFANGFSMADAALQNRRRLDMVQKQAEQENARYQDNVKRDDTRYQEMKDRQGRLDQQTVDWHNEASKRQSDMDTFTKQKTQDELDLRKQAEANQTEIQRGSLAIQQQNANIHAAQANEAIQNARFERRFMMEQKEREAAAMRAQNLFATDPSTGLTTLNLTPGNELNDLKDIQTAYGVNVANVARDLPKYQQQVATVKTALVDPRHFQQNKESVLQALNDIEGHDINKGLGDYDGTNKDLRGGKVVKKEISDIYPSPDGRGFVFNVKTYVEKGGKTYTDEGPMTKFRSSNPEDNQIRVIGVDQIIRRLDGYDALSKTLAANPQFTRAINSITSKGKGKHEYKTAKVLDRTSEGDATGYDRQVLVDESTGNIVDPEERLTQQKELQEMIEARKGRAKARGPSLMDVMQ